MRSGSPHSDATKRTTKPFRIRGFTLVELIVVITILAILATVGFLALSGYTQDAKDSAIKANVRSLQTAITSEAAITNNSPRYYVIHDADYALSGAFAYVDGASVALTGGDVGSAPLDSNYTAGKPDFKKLKLNPEKFKISASGLPGGTMGVIARATGFGADSAEASYDAGSLMAAGADFTTAGANGKRRIVSYVQTAGISPATKLANVAGNFPASDVPAGNVSGLLRAEPGSATNLTGALMDGGSAKATATGNQASSDTSWNVVSLLLHGDGTDGAQNGTITDSSSNAFTVTKNGNVTQGSFSPYSGQGGSAYFDGTGDRLSVWPSVNLNMTGDFTWETWTYVEASWNSHIMGLTNGDYYAETSLWYGLSWAGTFSFISKASTILTSAHTFPLKTWHHVAVTRNGTTTRLFVNGVLEASSTTAWSPTAWHALYLADRPNGAVNGQYPLKGYLSDTRAVIWSASYVANFTRPSNPLANVAGTALLLNYSGAGVLDSASKSNLEPLGNARISTAKSKFWGSSLYFDGTGDAFQIQNPLESIGTVSGDFTLETWVNWATVPPGNGSGNERQIIGQHDWPESAGTGNWWALLGTNDGARFYINEAGSTNVVSATTATWTADTWYHLAVVRSGSTITIYRNGVSIGTGTSSKSIIVDNSEPLTIGADDGANATVSNAYFDDLRISKTARYVSDFSAALPSAAFPNQ